MNLNGALCPARATRATCAAWLCALAGCASEPPTHFHTLLPAPGAASAPALHWELLSVTVPVQVDQPQWVVRQPDDTLALLENERWIAPLADEMRAALAERLRQAGPVLGQPGTWRITVEVQRFDSLPGRQARLEAEWSLLPPDGKTARQRCRGVFEEPTAGPSYAALAAAHRAAVARLGDAIGAALQSLDRGAMPTCP